MPNCTNAQLLFPSFDRRKIEASFDGGNVSSDGGLMLLRQVEERLGLIKDFSRVLPDDRHPSLISHSQEELLAQRIFGLAQGYEDLNDHDTLRHDLLWQTAVHRDTPLASSPTLCRLEKRADRQSAVAMHAVLVEKFIASFRNPPERLILDFDATDDRVHGHQEGRFFHGYYGDYCFLPLYVFCNDQLLVSYLRPSNSDGARHAWAILKLLVTRLREQWPEVKILLRADSGFCRQRMLNWCDWAGVEYVIGVARNGRLEAMAEVVLAQAEVLHKQSGQKQRLFADLRYAAKTWAWERRVILKAEVTQKGRNPRFVVTNLEGDAQAIYDEIYCARGEMENRIKEQQLGLFSDRTSAHGWWANQLRVLLSAAAYVLMETLRRVALEGTELARAQVGTIRLKLLKIGTVIVRNTRRIRLLLSSAYPYQGLFAQVAQVLRT